MLHYVSNKTIILFFLQECHVCTPYLTITLTSLFGILAGKQNVGYQNPKMQDQLYLPLQVNNQSQTEYQFNHQGKC